MADLQSLFGGGFDTSSVPPQEDFVVIPPDKYVVVIDAAEVKPTKSQTGHYIELTMTVVDGQYKDRKVWDRINIANPSQKCVEIGLRSLAALGLAVGLSSIADTDQLLGKVAVAHVKVKEGQNEVRTYSAVNPTATQQPTQLPFPSPTQHVPTSDPAQHSNPTVASGVKPPWAR